MTLSSITKLRIPRKLKKSSKGVDLVVLQGKGYRFTQEAELKEKYRYSKDDLEHLFV